jgi:hypothetical protein
MWTISCKRARAVSDPARGHLQEAPVALIGRHQRPADPVLAAHVNANGRRPTSAPVFRHLLPLANRVWQ